MIPLKPKDAMWSDEQWLAIYESGKDILVNAGAGSGKTAVLTERILQILKKGIAIDQLIVLTFTKAAASEMKERLREKLEVEVKKNHDENLESSLANIDSANISTFDSYALSLVKRYHYILGVDHSIQIGDSVIFSIQKTKMIDQVFEEFYESQEEDFLSLVSLFSIKNDNQLKKYVQGIDDKLNLLVDKASFLDNYDETFYLDDFIDKKISEYVNLLEIEKKRVKMRLEKLKNEITDEALIEHVYEIDEALAILFSSKKYEDYLKVSEITLPRMPRYVLNQDEKSRLDFDKKEIKESIKKIIEYTSYTSTDEMKQEIVETKKFANILVRILKRIDSLFIAYKMKMNFFEFHDIAKLAIKLLRENSEVRESIKEYTYEILIDEYQDTSDIQDILISYISKNNVYMVGDMKQSIYRFRNANPTIFKNKYQAFKEKNLGLAIDLSKNFRSRLEVLDNINLIFSQVMSIDIGGVDYNFGHQLLNGNKSYPNSNSQTFDLEIKTYNYEEHPLSKHEIEAFMVAHDILDKINSKFKVYDKFKRLLRPCDFGDFTILTAEKREFDLYKKIFEYMQIPLVIHKEDDFIRSNEIYVVKNLLRLVYCYYDSNYSSLNFKDAALGVLRSFLFEASDDIVDEIVESNSQATLNLRFPDLGNDLINISKDIDKSTTCEILDHLYGSFHIYEKLVRIGNVERAENKLNYLYLKFKEFDQIGFTLFDCINYLETILEENLDVEYTQSLSIDENVVNMMSIHRSKGLEFPICYFSELDHRFNFNDVKERVIFEKNYGIILPVFKEGLKDTIYKQLLRQEYRLEEISERIRLFYVALTRAKEKMIIVCPKFGTCFKQDKELVPVVDRLNYNSIFSILESISYSLSDYTKEELVNEYNNDYNKYQSILKLSFPDALDIIKYQVNLKKQMDLKLQASSSVRDLLSRESLEVMELGKTIHSYLETIDFKLPISPQIDSIQESEFVKKKLNHFFDSSLIRNLKIEKTYHEYEFIHKINDETIHGIIDLILETPSELIIIDYKLSNLDKEDYQKQLSIYKDYLKCVSKKEVSAYLYSIIHEEFQFVA